MVAPMSETATVADARPYHHGDLRRALIDAARRILENEGPGALSLRAVAREAKVSPAAPYHHFKDKGELLEAVAHEGWDALGDAMGAGLDIAPTDHDRMSAIGVAYVEFARDNPALYRVMYDRSRDKDELPEQMRMDNDGAYCMVRDALRAKNPGSDDMDVELATIAAWCAAHGLAEMLSFKQFEPLKTALGGEEAFMRAVLEHLGMFARVHGDGK